MSVYGGREANFSARFCLKVKQGKQGKVDGRVIGKSACDKRQDQEATTAQTGESIPDPNVKSAERSGRSTATSQRKSVEEDKGMRKRQGE